MRVNSSKVSSVAGADSHSGRSGLAVLLGGSPQSNSMVSEREVRSGRASVVEATCTSRKLKRGVSARISPPAAM